MSPDAKKQANAKKTISTISQITSLFSASATGLDFKTAQQTAKNAAENNALKLTHLHSIQSLKVLVALNTYLVDQGKDNNSFVIRDSGGASFVIDGKSYSLTNGSWIRDENGNPRNPQSYHNVNRVGQTRIGGNLEGTVVNNGAGYAGDISTTRSEGISSSDMRNVLNALGIDVVGNYGDHLHFRSTDISVPGIIQTYVNQVGQNEYLSHGSETRYPIFNNNGVGFFSNNGRYGTGITRQKFNTHNELQNFLTPTVVQDYRNWQSQSFINSANSYQSTKPAVVK